MAPRETPGKRATRDDTATVASRIADMLRQDITQGVLAGGQRLNEVALAKQHGISRIPLREALRILEGQGLVEIRPFGGAFVAELSADEAQDIYEIFEVLEAIAIREALPNLTNDDLREAEQAARMAEREPDPRRRMDLLDDFYTLIYGAVPRRHLMAALRRMALNESRYTFAFFAAVRLYKPNLPGPRDFIKVLRKRDIEAALVFQHEWRCAQRNFICAHIRALATERDLTDTPGATQHRTASSKKK